MKSTILALCFFYFQISFSQDCNCINEFNFVNNFYEENNPAFQKIKNNSTEYKEYFKKLKKLKTEVKLNKQELNCAIYLNKYIALLKDNHSDIGYNFKMLNLNTSIKLDSFKQTKRFKKYKKIKINTEKLINLQKNKLISDIEGIYSDGDQIKFAIIKKENEKDKYIGVVLEDTKLLEIGHILVELNRVKDNNFRCIYNVGLLGVNFDKVYKEMNIFNGQISNFGFSKLIQNEILPYEFKSINKTTNYMRLSSFNRSLIPNLNQFYKSHQKDIVQKPNLIIDIRDNSGGSDESFFELMPYIYSKPIKIDSVLVWVSPKNIELYENNEKDASLIKRMKKSKSYTFIPQVEGKINTWKMDSVSDLPKKIVLIYNKNTASAAESFISYAIQSDKVITIGENSGGYFGFGDVMTSQTPCGKYYLRSTTTKYHENAKYEFVGIPPMYFANEKKDWIEYAVELFNK